MSADMSNPSKGPDRLDILIVENDPAAARLIKEAFAEAGLTEYFYSVPGVSTFSC
jgi:CheY-like chemotaxis protein